jgi:hypothetical protein
LGPWSSTQAASQRWPPPEATNILTLSGLSARVDDDLAMSSLQRCRYHERMGVPMNVGQR